MSDLTAAGPAERHRLVAGVFTDRVVGAPTGRRRPRSRSGRRATWSVTWSSGSRGSSPVGASSWHGGPSVDDDPVAAWRAHADAVQGLLDAPDADRPFTHPRAGSHALDQAIDMFYTSDVFMHTWDVARATGQDDTLDEDSAPSCWRA